MDPTQRPALVTVPESTSTEAVTNARPERSRRSRAMAWLVPVALFVIAFLVRDVRLGSFSWPDELTWTARSVSFYARLAEGDLRGTHQADHPGVVPMWGYGGFLSLRALLDGTLPELYTMTTERKLQDIPAMLATEALWTVLITSLAVVGIYLLLKRILDPRVGVVAALLVALDPFFLVQSRVVHLDAILTSFMTLATLAMAVYLVHPKRKRYLLLSAAFGGLALATKSPALVLIPLVGGGLALRLFLYRDNPSGRGRGEWRQRLLWAGQSLLAWVGICWAVFLAVWPAAWFDPLRLTALVILGSQWGVVASHQFNYFMGQVTETPGYLFYLIVGPLRMTPLTLVFAPLSAVLVVTDLSRVCGALLPKRCRHCTQASPGARLVVLALGLALVIGYGLGMSISAKKGDRYLIPIFPMLDILAALSLMALLGWIGQRWRPLAANGRQLAIALVAILVVALLWLPLAPYYGAYFNPLLGGARTAVWAFPFGQGEGLDMVADYINGQEDAQNLRVASFYPEDLQAYLLGHVISLRRNQWNHTWQFSDYVVFYVSQVQRQLPGPDLVALFKDREPEYTARIGGVDFAWVYKPPLLLSGAPPAASHETWAVLDDQIALTGYDLGHPELQIGRPWDITLRWQALRHPDANYRVALRLTPPHKQHSAELDASQERVVWQTDWAPFEDHYPTKWWRVGQTEFDRQTLQLPESLLAGQLYCLEVQLYDPAEGKSLPLTEGGQGTWLPVTCLTAGEP